MGVRAKCQAADLDFPLAADLDFQKAGAAHLAVAGRRGVRVHLDAPERFLPTQPQAALQKVVYSREQRPLAEPVLLQAAKRELQDEWVSARQALWALPQLELPLGPVMGAWGQFSEPQA